MKRFRVFFLLLLLPVAARAGDLGQPLKLYIALNGDDRNEGTIEAPFKTLEKARDTIRQIKVSGWLPSGDATVYIRGGDYYLTQGFLLNGAQDSGTTDSPIVYQAYPGEKVSLKGAKKLDIAKFEAVTDPAVLSRLPAEVRGKVKVLDLRGQGITDYGSIVGYGHVNADFNRLSPLGVELFFNDEPMTLGRWPNSGYTYVGEFPDDKTKRNTNRAEFPYLGERPARWTQAADFWMHGFMNQFSDERVKLGSVDPARKTITFVPGSERPVGSNIRCYYFNLLEEVDSPGEYYIDRENGRLYFYPPANLSDGIAELSTLEGPLVGMSNTDNVSFQGLTFDMVRGNAIEITGGTDNIIKNCIIKNVGKVGVVIGGDENPFQLEGPMSPYAYYGVEGKFIKFPDTGVNPFDGGTNNQVVGCDIYNIGTTGVAVTGGDRKKLIPGNNLVHDNQIYKFSRYKLTYEPAVNIGGCGNRVSHNLLHHGPAQAILFRGNDQVIEYNEIADVVLETNDAGAIYTWATWSSRGNEIRYNYFHDIFPHVTFPPGNGVCALYFDDLFGSAKVYGNVFYNASGVQINGGRDFEVFNNMIINGLPPQAPPFMWDIVVNDRSWGGGPNVGASWLSGKELRKFDYKNSPWKDRYPQLVNIFEDSPGFAMHNKLTNNVTIRGKGVGLHPNNTAPAYDNTLTDNYTSKEDPGFADMANCDFTLKSDSPVYQKIPGFKAVGFKKIGLLDKSRSKLKPAQYQSEIVRSAVNMGGETPIFMDDFECYEVDARNVPFWACINEDTSDGIQKRTVGLDPTDKNNKMFHFYSENKNSGKDLNNEIRDAAAKRIYLSAGTVTSFDFVYDRMSSPDGCFFYGALSGAAELGLVKFNGDGTVGFIWSGAAGMRETIVPAFTHHPNQRYHITVILDPIAKKASLLIDRNMLIANMNISAIIDVLAKKTATGFDTATAWFGIKVPAKTKSAQAPNNVTSVYLENYSIIEQYPPRVELLNQDRLLSAPSCAVELQFANRMNPESTKQLSQSIVIADGGIVKSATWSDDLRKVTVCLEQLTADKTYSLDIPGIKDLAGNTPMTTRFQFKTGK
jgi:hypothetical protein